MYARPSERPICCKRPAVVKTEYAICEAKVAKVLLLATHKRRGGATLSCLPCLRWRIVFLPLDEESSALAGHRLQYMHTPLTLRSCTR